MRNSSISKACANYVLGKSTGIKIKGSPEKIRVFHEVLSASRTLYVALCESKSLKHVQKLIEKKQLAAEEFKKLTGNIWFL